MAASDDDGWWSRWCMGRGVMDGWGWGDPMMGYGSDAMLDRIDGRLAYIKTELKITDMQASAWDELAKVIRDTTETHNAMMREMMKDVRSSDFLKKPLPQLGAYRTGYGMNCARSASQCVALMRVTQRRPCLCG